MAPGKPAEELVAREIVDNVNTLAAAVRAGVGLVVFTKHTFDAETAIGWSVWRDHFATGGWGCAWKRRSPPAITATSSGLASMLVQTISRYRNTVQRPRAGIIHLDAILRRRDIDTIIVTGTVTNVCCKSTTRDAMMMNYKCVMVSDANAASATKNTTPRW